MHYAKLSIIGFGGIVVALSFGIGCGTKNTQAQRDAVKAEVMSYCDCVKASMSLPPAEFLKSSCSDDAFDKAWAALPDRANGDEDAAALFELQHKCYRLQSDARLEVRRMTDDR
jgi:hypothetical protein